MRGFVGTIVCPSGRDHPFDETMFCQGLGVRSTAIHIAARSTASKVWIFRRQGRYFSVCGKQNTFRILPLVVPKTLLEKQANIHSSYMQYIRRSPTTSNLPTARRAGCALLSEKAGPARSNESILGCLKLFCLGELLPYDNWMRRKVLSRPARKPTS